MASPTSHADSLPPPDAAPETELFWSGMRRVAERVLEPRERERIAARVRGRLRRAIRRRVGFRASAALAACVVGYLVYRVETDAAPPSGASVVDLVGASVLPAVVAYCAGATLTLLLFGERLVVRLVLAATLVAWGAGLLLEGVLAESVVGVLVVGGSVIWGVASLAISLLAWRDDRIWHQHRARVERDLAQPSVAVFELDWPIDVPSPTDTSEADDDDEADAGAPTSPPPRFELLPESGTVVRVGEDEVLDPSPSERPPRALPTVDLCARRPGEHSLGPTDDPRVSLYARPLADFERTDVERLLGAAPGRAAAGAFLATFITAHALRLAESLARGSLRIDLGPMSWRIAFGVGFVVVAWRLYAWFRLRGDVNRGEVHVARLRENHELLAEYLPDSGTVLAFRGIPAPWRD